MTLAAGTRLGPYEILAQIGEGGMGVVYRPATHGSIVRWDRQARKRLRSEAMAAAALDHPYICKIFEIGEHGDALFLVMEYIAGETLHRRSAIQTD
jgi:serine/threonine protein kinase